MPTYVYTFGIGGKAEGDPKRKDKLGGKGAGLAEMTNLGLPVPPGFTITTDVCTAFQKEKKYPEGFIDAVRTALSSVETALGKIFGDRERPLLLSVRSGARASM